MNDHPPSQNRSGWVLPRGWLYSQSPVSQYCLHLLFSHHFPFSLFTERGSTVAFLVSLLLSSNILFTYSLLARCLLSYVLYKCVSSENNGTIRVVRLRIYPCVYAVYSMCFSCFCKWCPGCTSRPDPRTRLKKPKAKLYGLSQSPASMRHFYHTDLLQSPD